MARGTVWWPVFSLLIAAGTAQASNVRFTGAFHPHDGDTIPLDADLFPSAGVRNQGATEESLWAVVRLEDICRDVVWTDSIRLRVASGESLLVQFDTWRPEYRVLHRARFALSLGDTSPWIWFWVGGSGVDERPTKSVGPPADRSLTRTATVVRGVFCLGGDRGSETGERSELRDASGKRVMRLRTGTNDIHRLAPGVYFVRREPGLKPQAQAAVRKVIHAR